VLAGCLVVRNGHFYKCTRAAYAEEFHWKILGGVQPGDRAAAEAGDGVAVDRPDFGEAILDYLNRAEPLASCRYCHGGNGPVVPHSQLRVRDIKAGRLLPSPLASPAGI
jgi:hypothetical protein